MDKIFEKRIGVSIAQFPKLVKCTWPLGKITMFKQHLQIDTLMEKFTLQYSDIDYIDINLFQVDIYHHNIKVPESVLLYGLRLYNGIKQAITRNGLKIIIK